jgi:hypothetical protein
MLPLEKSLRLPPYGLLLTPIENLKAILPLGKAEKR